MDIVTCEQEAWPARSLHVRGKSNRDLHVDLSITSHKKVLTPIRRGQQQQERSIAPKKEKKERATELFAKEGMHNCCC